MEMTPFERAEKAVAEIEGRSSRERAIIETAIRAAENDTLERAASAVWRESCDSFLSAAAFIRTLKHK
jgi:hypothetical protein